MDRVTGEVAEGPRQGRREGRRIQEQAPSILDEGIHTWYQVWTLPVGPGCSAPGDVDDRRPTGDKVAVDRSGGVHVDDIRAVHRDLYWDAAARVGDAAD